MSSQSIQKKIDELTARMLKAAEDEDFETAARLRNDIAELRGPTVRQPPPGQLGRRAPRAPRAPPAPPAPPERLARVSQPAARPGNW